MPTTGACSSSAPACGAFSTGARSRLKPPVSRRRSTSCCSPSGATPTRAGPRSATWPTTCSCAITARSGSSTGPRTPGSSAAARTATTTGSSGCTSPPAAPRRCNGSRRSRSKSSPASPPACARSGPGSAPGDRFGDAGYRLPAAAASTTGPAAGETAAGETARARRRRGRRRQRSRGRHGEAVDRAREREERERRRRDVPGRRVRRLVIETGERRRPLPRRAEDDRVGQVLGEKVLPLGEAGALLLRFVDESPESLRVPKDRGAPGRPLRHPIRPEGEQDAGHQERDAEEGSVGEQDQERHQARACQQHENPQEAPLEPRARRRTNEPSVVHCVLEERALHLLHLRVERVAEVGELHLVPVLEQAGEELLLVILEVRVRLLLLGQLPVRVVQEPGRARTGT